MKDRLREFILRNEGCSLSPYRCPSGKLTIGVGRNLDDVGISYDEAMFLLENDIAAVINDLSRFFYNWSELSENRKVALADLRFNVGSLGFRRFKKMINAVLNKDFSRAADEMIDSRWYRQVPNRAKVLVDMMRNG